MSDLPRVLIIDDSPLIRARYGAAIKEAGYEVLEAPNGSDGFNKAIIEKPDLIILDLVMPRMGGLGVLDLLKSDMGMAETPVIMLTSAARDDQKQEAIDKGVKAFFSKNNATVEEVVEEIKRLVPGPR